jgi:hypothetical protein
MHLLIECPWTRQIWSTLANWSKLQSLQPASWTNIHGLSEWLSQCRLSSPADKRKGAQSLLMLAVWEIWRERNRRIFQQEELSIQGLLVRIRDEATLWNMAGASIPFDPG